MEGMSAPVHVAMPKSSTKTLDVTKDKQAGRPVWATLCITLNNNGEKVEGLHDEHSVRLFQLVLVPSRLSGG
jgi:hypothetical protein